MVSANNDSFIFSFPIWMPFLSFFHLIALARTFNTLLNNSGKSGSLLPNIKGKGFHFFAVKYDGNWACGLCSVEVPCGSEVKNPPST